MNNKYEFALGYFDGRGKGIYNNPYDDNDMSNSYKLGYNKGVADCFHYEKDLIDHEMECGK
jgi:hypothetical protein